MKSYSVAVEGLGRAPDFDAIADSYPRVQISRLRKQLAAHYARHHVAGRKICLYLQPGSYLVRVAGLATAYPDLYHPLFDGSRPSPQSEFGSGNAGGGRNVALTKGVSISTNLLPWILGSMIVMAIAVALVLTW